MFDNASASCFYDWEWPKLTILASSFGVNVVDGLLGPI
jgi:hypothetical protein